MTTHSKLSAIDAAVWSVGLCTFALALIVAGGFGLLLLGDELGLWSFDSGLGRENGDA